MTDTNASYAVYVLGDKDTSQRLEMLAAKAAEHGAVIGKAFAFGNGEAADTDDLSTVDAVVEALGRAITKRRPIWLPFWQDLSREQHLRSLSLAMQRHGIDLLIGPQLTPVPLEGGINQMDAALRHEVKAVFRLDDAAVASAGMKSLVVEIKQFLADEGPAPAPAEEPPADDEPRERLFNALEAARLLGRSPNWLVRGLHMKTFGYADGSPVEPLRFPDGERHVLTVPMVRAIAWSAYRCGDLSPQRLGEVLADLRSAR